MSRDLFKDFDQRFVARRDKFDRDFAKAERRGVIIAAIVLPLYLIGVLLVLGLLAVALYAALRAVGWV